MSPGDRIELHPASDLWMQGVRFGTVTRVGKTWVHFKDDSGHLRKVQAHNIVSVNHVRMPFAP
jgi:hypothetical protein